MSEDDDNLVAVKAWRTDGEPFLVLHRNPDEPYCGHRCKALLDDDKRTVRCSLCGAQLDPFDVLLKFARHEYEFVHTRERRQALERQIDLLRAEERRIKDRLRRARAREEDR